MAYDLAADVRLDPRLKALLAVMPTGQPLGDVDSRETLLAQASAAAAQRPAFTDRLAYEKAAPSAGLRVHTEKVVSQPDGNTINLQVIRPDNNEILACVYYIHGGGMASLSCFDDNYTGWGRLIAANGVAVVMVDFRNSVSPSSVPEVAPFPAGLNDCVSGLKWTAANAGHLGIDPGRIVGRGLKRRRQPDPGYRARAQARRRPGPDQRPVRAVPVHRGPVADPGEPVLHREQRHQARPAQQPRRGRLRHRGVQRPEPAGLAVVRHPRRRSGLPADGHQRQRVRPAARRGHQLLPPAPAGRSGGPGRARCWARCTAPRPWSPPAPRSAAIPPATWLPSPGANDTTSSGTGPKTRPSSAHPGWP